MKRLNPTLLVATLALTPVLAPADHHEKSESPKKEEAAEAKTEKADQTVVVEANDQMQFNKKAIEIKAGETVALTLKHVGKLPKETMGHNLVILDKGTNLANWAVKAMAAPKNDYIPTTEAEKEAILAHTELLGGGEEDTITFSIKEAGEYEFLCSFPGHFAVMKGKVTVK